jgi:MFS family permease
MFSGFKPSKLSSEFKVTLISISFYGWSLSLVLQYLEIFAVAIGVNPAVLGLLVGTGQFLGSLFSPLLGWIADFYGVKKALILGLIASMSAFGLYFLAVSWWVVIPAIILFNIARMTIIPFSDIIFVGTTEANFRAMAIGLGRMLWAFLNSSAPICAAFIIVTFGGMNPKGIRPLFFISTFLNVLALLLIILFLKLRSPLSEKEMVKQKMDVGSKVIGFIRNFREVLTEKGLKRWLLINVIRRITMSISVAYVPLWMINVKGADPNILGLLGFIGLVTYAAAQFIAGVMADRIGRKKAFIFFEAFRYIGTFWLVVAAKPEHLVLVGLLGAFGLALGIEGSGIGGGSFLPFMVLSWEIVPEDKRGRWHGIISLLSFFNIFCGILAGVMWEQGLMVELLILPLIIEACVALPLVLTFSEPERN